ncbi:MAG: CvpA family protein [Burkholderiales bacterium]
MDELFISWLDIGLLAFLAVSMLIGLMRGFVFELLSLAGWFVAYFVARFATPLAQPHLHIGEAGSNLHYGATFAIVFLVALVVWSLGARLVRALIRATPLSPIDRVLGAGFGLVRGLVVLLIAVLLIGVSPWSQSTAWKQSLGVAWLSAMVHELRPLFLNDVSQHPSA